MFQTPRSGLTEVYHIMEEAEVEAISKEALEGVEGDIVQAVWLRIKSRYPCEKPQIFATDCIPDSFMQQS